MFARRRKKDTSESTPSKAVPLQGPGRNQVRSKVEANQDSLLAIELQPFKNLYAPVVASWVTDKTELFWVAPATRPPLTAAKVVSWKRGLCRPFVAFRGGQALPFGYAEVNPLGDGTGEMWVGHVITDPKSRGRGLGLLFVEELVRKAFSELDGDRLVLVVFPENDIAIHCYQRAGFGITARETRRFPGRRGIFTMLRMEKVRGKRS